jgi:hypothetical protein
MHPGSHPLGVLLAADLVVAAAALGLAAVLRLTTLGLVAGHVALEGLWGDRSAGGVRAGQCACDPVPG